MRFSTLLVNAMAMCASAAPSYPEIEQDSGLPRRLDALSEYFGLLAMKVQTNRHSSLAPSCDLSRAQMPIATEPLPPVSEGLHLQHVAVGRGTQNYTCDAGNSTAAPKAAGAVASLFNVSCIAATYPDLLELIPKVSMQFDLSSKPLLEGADNQKLGPSNVAYAGDHFFHDATTPFFHVQEGERRIGNAYVGLNSSTPAPARSAVGQGGEPAVPWLKLMAKEGAPTTNDIREIYRVTTAGGTAPASCADMPSTFEVQYAAAYWFYAGPAPTAEEENNDA